MMLIDPFTMENISSLRTGAGHTQTGLKLDILSNLLQATDYIQVGRHFGYLKVINASICIKKLKSKNILL